MVAFSTVVIGVVVTVSFVLLLRTLGKGLNVVWDLDDTLIKSVHLETYEDASKKCSIVKMDRYVFEHIDDDIMHFRTYIRPWTRFILLLLKCCGVKQYVFTSATIGYMNNVCKFLDPNNNIFEIKKLSTSDFEKGVLSKDGKNIKLLFNGNDNDHDQHLCHSLLVDDKIKYHTPQPRNGILCNRFNVLHQNDKALSKMNILSDFELLKVLVIICQCLFVSDITSIISKYQPPEYKKQLM